MKLSKDVYKLDRSGFVNVYLLNTEKGPILIDTGIPGDPKPILDFISENAVGPLKFIVLTHADLDHLGKAAELKRRTHAKLAIHEADAPFLRGGKSPKLSKSLMAKILKFFFKMSVEPAEPDMLLRSGSDLGGYRIIHVPGHTPGSIALFNKKNGVLVSGDALLGDNEGNLRDPEPRLAWSWELTEQSAHKLKALKYKLLLPGHGNPVSGLKHQDV